MSTQGVHYAPTQSTGEMGPNGHAAWGALYHALRVLPMADVVPHEAFNPQRAADLADRLAADGRLVNPPIVAPLDGKYVVLDGATRLTALQQLGYPHLIAQMVDPAQTSLQLHTWLHAVCGGPSRALLEQLRQVYGLLITPAPRIDLRPMPLTPETLAYLVTPEGDSYRLALDPTLHSAAPHSAAPHGARPRPTAVDHGALEVLNRMVEVYSAWGHVERTLSIDMATLAQQYRDLAGLIILPQFSVAAVLDLAVQGRTIPAGITRFVIPGRILRLNVPLAKLASPESLAAKQQWLDALVREKIAYRQVRYYEEPVVLLDE